MKRTNPFYSVPHQSLDKQLEPPEASRLLKKDIDRRQNLPGLIAGGARLSGVADRSYFTNASAGTVTEPVSIVAETVPLVLVWYLGSIDSTGAVVNDDAALMTAEQATPIFSGATAKASWDKTTLTITIVSTNVASANTKTAYFFYAVYYDTTDNTVNEVGL
jgi:hypothetical protein